MLPSSTVENYLKAIYLGQTALTQGQQLVSMGHIATAVGVAPGTATTMIKALAESGLVQYEPYSGVRLTSAGEKLAALVLRRHRLVELFLVKVMGMSWADVHDEAEQLEHVVSDRLIERIDEMLGHPKADPHGDPIPGPEGTVNQEEFLTLLTCPLNTPVTVTRISDQDAAFLRFIETHELKPGQSIEVEARDPAADSVRIRGRDDRRVTIGTRAASKLLVHVGAIVLCLLASVSGSFAQEASPGDAQLFEILDNSFLVEEAFNQEAGIFQNIFTFTRTSSSDREATFTQEWPVRGQRHQFSYTVPFAWISGSNGIGDVLLNYRLQLFTETARRPAASPRVSLVLPTGNEGRDLGDGVVGVQMNFPFSKQLGDVYLHWNVGVTHLPSVDGTVFVDGADRDFEQDLTSPSIAGSAIWRVRPMLNVMIEAIADFQEALGAQYRRVRRDTTVTLSPGFRGGWNVGDKQIIIGAAVPIDFTDDETGAGVFGYFSYELPFTR